MLWSLGAKAKKDLESFILPKGMELELFYLPGVHSGALGNKALARDGSPIVHTLSLSGNRALWVAFRLQPQSGEGELEGKSVVGTVAMVGDFGSGWVHMHLFEFSYTNGGNLEDRVSRRGGKSTALLQPLLRFCWQTSLIYHCPLSDSSDAVSAFDSTLFSRQPQPTKQR